MFNRISQWKYLPWLIFTFAWLLYLYNSGAASIYILDEAKNAECAREMLERSDFIVPTFNQILRTDKPPLHYFLMMISYSAFGVNPFAARFFSALFGALTVLITYLFTRKYAGAKTALLTTMVLLASVHLNIQFHLAVPDPYLVFFTTAAIISFFLFLQEKKFIYGLSFYVAISMGTLAKGPIAIALPGLIFLLYLLFSKQLKWQIIQQLKPFSGALLVLLIALPWYIIVHFKTDGSWTEGFFMKHNLERFANEMEGHGGTFMTTILFVLVGLFPFSVFLPQAIRHAFKNHKDHFTLFNLIAGLTIVGFFILSSTRLPNYTVPALPFLAVLTALFMQAKWDNFKAFRTGIWIIFAISLILIPALLVALKTDPALSVVSDVSWYFLPFPILISVAVFFYYRRQTASSLGLILIGGLTVAIIFFGFVFPKIDRENPVAKSFHLIENKEVRYFRKFNASFSFSLKKEIPEIEENEIAGFFEHFPEGVIISTQDKVDQIELPQSAEISFEAHDIFEKPTTVLITRKK
ncbi:ArnT family glycosyltransferase [Mangrovibacterium lignilyticum]|uniref:ArnT family glycosyltransferase n=1 Tax=Mangrovibacterium lignilyticum TaxID=2668052 RepID=UPI0013D6C58F|nr:glycosyltransferase family 39 protein [Mangrovibacterium lignilyticum]